MFAAIGLDPVVLRARQLSQAFADPNFTEVAIANDPEKDIFGSYWGSVLQSEDEILRQRGDGSFKLYRDLLRLGLVRALWDQRVSALISKEWEVLSGDPEDPVANQARDLAHWVLDRVGLDNLTEKLAYGVWYGRAVAEIIWQPYQGEVLGLPGSDWVIPAKIAVRRPERFTFGRDLGLRLLTRSDPFDGIPVPERQFLVVQHGSEWDDDPFGIGLAANAYWILTFMKATTKAWLLFLQRAAGPTAVSEFPRGASSFEQEVALSAARAVQQGNSIAVPEGMVLRLLESNRSGGDYEVLYNSLKADLQFLLVGQSVTSEGSRGFANGDVQMQVLENIVKSDSDLLNAAISDQFLRWLTDFNFGEEVPSPKLWRKVETAEDLNATADLHLKLNQLGWELNPEQFQQQLGEGWQRVSLNQPGILAGEFAEPDDLAVVQAQLVGKTRAAMAAADMRILDRIREQVLAGVDAGESLGEIQERLDGLLDRSLIEERARDLARNMILAQVAGAYTVAEEQEQMREVV